MRDIILGHKAERDELLRATYVQREGIHNARQNMKNDLIKVIIGPRRAGKSVFGIQILDGLDFAYLNFDDERLLGISDYDDLLKGIRQVYGETKTILFDEIQNLNKWELFLNRLHRKGFNLIVTGSNSRLLSRELSTHLTGRFVQFQILPFSFNEFLSARSFSIDEMVGLKERQGTVLNLLSEYLEKGGYPEVLLKNIDPKTYIATLFESILFKDIVKRYNVRFAKKLYDLGLYLVTNHSNEFSYTSLKNALDFKSVHTVENYTEYLTEAFLIFYLERFSNKVKEQIKSPKKVYTYDTGIINAVKFKTAPDTGRLIENAVAIDLLRRGREFYSYKTKDGKEIDFAVKEGLNIIQLIQVCYDMGKLTTKKRELSALTKAAQETSCDNLLVITWDYENRESHERADIIYMPLWKWLIGDR
ncbi:ATP-binding protein [Candidatus Magnetominusculus dajiuhuensis]|uniref:ATP-binding protein n=1 Tax=Candidatus Magnetominusculus dajiuhuensis TaxID=3137712 RepID=UPI003B432D03